VARNRKRAKERRGRRPQPVGSRARDQLAGAPSPLEHAAPDAEIAEQAELPPSLSGPELEELELGQGEAELESDADEEPFEEEPEPSGGRGGGGGARIGAGFGGEDGGGSGELAAPGAPVPAPRVRPGNRLITFLEGSWRELQRVQWPDRRQVMQATGVVIGFVLIAGVLLGVSDFLAKHLIDFILNHHL
jgi:preprotein translocase SecE subunit